MAESAFTMSNATFAFAAIVPDDETLHQHAFGEELIFHLTHEQTGGKLSLWTEITPPGGGPPPHFHVREDEYLLVQDGRVSFFVDGQWRELGAGGAVFLPRGVVHTFRNVGDKPSRMLASTSPAGFETFFSRCAAEFRQPAGPNMDRIAQISAEHGIHFVKQ